MTITTVSIIDEIRLAIGDILTSNSGGTLNSAKILTDAQITAFVLKNAIPESNHTFTKLTDGYFASGGSNYYFKPTFSESSNCNYTFNATGSIVVTEGASGVSGTPIAGDETRSDITVTACRVNFNRIIADILIYLATQKAQIIAQSGDMGSISPSTVRYELMQQAAIWAQKEWIES